jgi:hypothetical protein
VRMKRVTVVLGILLVALTTMGFNCVNDAVLVSVNLPLTATFDITGNTGTSTYSKQLTISDYLDQSYLGKLQSVRFYDIKVSTIGTFAGSVAGSNAKIDNIVLLTLSGNWNDFNTPQSVLNSSHIVLNPAGVNQLITKLQQFKNTSTTTVVLSGTTMTTGGTFTSGLQVKIELLCQADANLGSSN